MLNKIRILTIFFVIPVFFLIGINQTFAQQRKRGAYLKKLIQENRNHTIEKEISPNIKMIMAGGAFPQWSATTNKITYTKKKGNRYEVFLMDADGNNEQCLTCENAALVNCGNRGQSYWHPSDKYIVFSAENANLKRNGLGVTARPGLGRNFNVWVMTTDGNNFWQLTDYPENWGVIETKFSHDGTKIYWNEEYSMEKYPQGKPEDPTPHPGSYWGRENFRYRKGEEICAWRVVYADISFEGGTPKMSNVKKINPPAGYTLIEANGFTPDDKGFVYDYDILAETYGVCMWGEIFTSDLDGNNLKRITNTPLKYNEDPVYSPDGKKLAFKEATKGKGMPEDGMELIIANADGSNRKQITHFSDPGAAEYRQDWMQIAEIDWSPDGKKLIFGMARGNKQAPKVDINADLYILTLPEDF